MEAGEVVTNVRELAPEYNVAHVAELIAVKESAEYADVPEDLADAALAALPDVGQALADSVDSSPLPLFSPNEAHLSDFLVRARRAAPCCAFPIRIAPHAVGWTPRVTGSLTCYWLEVGLSWSPQRSLARR